jgi:hypothetical protein
MTEKKPAPFVTRRKPESSKEGLMETPVSIHVDLLTNVSGLVPANLHDRFKLFGIRIGWSTVAPEERTWNRVAATSRTACIV